MRLWLRKFLGMNWILFLLMFGLMIYGVYAIYSATWMIPGQKFWKSQIVWILAALPVFFFISLIDYRWIRLGAVPCYVLGRPRVGGRVTLGVRDAMEPNAG